MNKPGIRSVALHGDELVLISCTMELNPGHLDSLRKLGILGEQEDTISPQALAERIAQSDKIDPAISDIRQEALNVAMAFDLVCQTIDDLVDALPDLNTKDEIEQELEGLAGEISQLVEFPRRINAIRSFAALILQLAVESGITFSAETKQHFEGMVAALEKIPENVGEISVTKLRQGEQIIDELTRRLEESN